MKNTLIMTLVGLSVGLGAGWLAFRASPEAAVSTMSMADSPGEAERRIAYYQDPMHPWYTSEQPGKAPDCGMDLVPVYEGDASTEGVRIDPAVVQNIGVVTEEARRLPLTRTIRATGRVAYDERRVHTVNTRVMGWVEKLHADFTGRALRRGEPLLELYSPELVSAQEEYLQALRYRDRFQTGVMDDARAGAFDLVESVRRRLLYWDIPEQEITDLETRGAPTRTMTIPAPVSGVILEKMVVAGQKIMAGMDLFRIADLSTVWVLADVYQSELPWVRIGQPVEVSISYMPGETLRGKVTYIYPYLNASANTASVRIEVSNTPSMDLKLDMLASVRILSPVLPETVVAPDQAIIRSGERNVVVVALGNGYFDPREVTLGLTGDGYTQVLSGLTEGEKIVTSAQFLIDSESNLKAAIQSMGAHAGHGGAGIGSGASGEESPVSNPAPTRQSPAPTTQPFAPTTQPSGGSGMNAPERNTRQPSSPQQDMERSGHDMEHVHPQ